MSRLSSPFLHHALSTNKLMALVCVALIPGIIVQTYFFGWGVLINVICCAVFALISEASVLKLRNKPIKKTLKDNSALLSGILLGIALPPSLPIWMSFIGVAFAIIIAKQLYGGLGFNPFNPAMVGYVLLLISFPVEMTAWFPSQHIQLNTPSFSEALSLIMVGPNKEINLLAYQLVADGVTMATPLDFTKTQFTQGLMTSEIFNNNQLIENINAWQLVNLSFLIGGIFLLANKIIRWHIPISILVSMYITSQIFYFYDPQQFTSSYFNLTTGATMLGAFFIATDPVSAATTPKGRIIYGVAIGALVIIIRHFGGYPEAFAFAVLLLNIAVPVIDHYTKPVIYGHQKLEASSDE
ncbi:electron transport complex subunit RsxD [Aliikangiella sp. IMCC44653]